MQKALIKTDKRSQPGAVTVWDAIVRAEQARARGRLVARILSVRVGDQGRRLPPTTMAEF